MVLLSRPLPQIGQLQAAAVDTQKEQLRRENQELRQEVDRLKNSLVALEKANGVPQVCVFTWSCLLCTRYFLVYAIFFCKFGLAQLHIN